VADAKPNHEKHARSRPHNENRTNAAWPPDSVLGKESICLSNCLSNLLPP
jgi:hypothetical protein